MVGQVNGRSYIRLGIKSAIVSCLSMNSPTPMPIRAIPSHPGRASCVRVLGARTLLREGGGREGRKEEGPRRSGTLRARSRARRSRFQGSIEEVRPSDPGTYSPHPHTDA